MSSLSGKRLTFHGYCSFLWLLFYHLQRLFKRDRLFYVQLAFALDCVKAVAHEHPEWKTTKPFKSVLAGDIKGVMASGEHS